MATKDKLATNRKGSTKVDFYDSWSNFISLIGDQFSGKVNNFKHKTNIPLTQTELDQIYSSDAIAAKLCDKPAEDMMRQGIKFNHKKEAKINDIYDKFQINSLLEQAIRYDRKDGGSALVLDVDDGMEDWSEPLKIEQVKDIKDIFVVDRFFLQPINYNNPLKMPETYYLLYDNKQEIIHSSRLILFTGIDSGIRNRFTNQGFGESAIYRAVNELRGLGIGYDIVPEILIDFVRRIYKFKDMTKKIIDGQGSVIKKKAAYLQATSNIFNALILDQEDDYVTRTINVSGIEDLIEILERRLCAAAGMPHTRLLEESPGGTLSNNGDNSEQSKQWYDWIKGQQIKKLSPAINKLNLIIAKVLGFGNGNSIKWEFCPLTQETEAQKIENQYKISQIDKAYYDMGLSNEIIFKMRAKDYNLTPEEILMYIDIAKKEAAKNGQPDPFDKPKEVKDNA